MATDSLIGDNTECFSFGVNSLTSDERALEEEFASDNLSEIQTLTLPIPPSVNAMFRNVRGKGRVKTAVYRHWRDECVWRLRAQNPRLMPGEVVIIIGVDRTSFSADIDNRIKALLDLVVAEKVIEDDSHVVGLATAWQPGGNGLARMAILPAQNMTVEFQLAKDGRTGGWIIVPPQPNEGCQDGVIPREPEEGSLRPAAKAGHLRPRENGQDVAGLGVSEPGVHSD